MRRTVIQGTGFYVPERIVTNDELAGMIDTSDEWIRERTGIVERRWVEEGVTGAEMALRATTMALDEAGMKADQIDAIILATLSPDHFFPGTGVFLQRELGAGEIPALDIRAQCSGFVYGLSVADAWIRSGQYETILLVGVEIQSTGRMTGDIRAPKIVIAEGAVFRGNSDMSPHDAKRGKDTAAS